MAENRKTDNSIIFEAEDGTEVEFSVVEQTTLGGVNYLFVIDKADDESSLSFARTTELIRKRWRIRYCGR